jgi:zinc transport system ATP-binding protein
VNQPIIRATGLSVLLGRIPVLRSIELSVEQGEAIALMGANGSGKTTLVRTLLGLTPYQHGEVRLFGTELSAFRDWARIGYVPQRAQISYPQARVNEVVATGLLAGRAPFRPLGRADKARIQQVLEQVGLAERAGHPYRRLSGGQQQRVLIARALVSAADLLVMDEPLAGIDLPSQERLAEILAALKAEQKTLVIVLHETGSLAPLLDRQVVLRDGRMLPEGSEHRHPHDGHETLPREHAPLLRGVLEHR